MEIDSFLTYLADVKRYSVNTLVAYREDLTQFLTYCTKYELINDYPEVTSKMIRRLEAGWITGGLNLGKDGGTLKPMTAKSVRRKLSSLRTYFRFLIREGKTQGDPTEVVIVPKIGKRLPVFVPGYKMDELLDGDVLKGTDFSLMRDRLVLMMAYYTGMRRSELVGLKCTDVDLMAKQIRVNGKGDKQRIVPMIDELVGEVESYLKERGKAVVGNHTFFFVTDKGTPVYDKFIYRLVVKYLNCVTSSSKRSPHVLRHSFATGLLNNGACIEAIKELLGHANLAATQVYTHNSFENLKKVYNQAHPRA